MSEYNLAKTGESGSPDSRNAQTARPNGSVTPAASGPETAEDALRRENDCFRAAFDNLSHGLCMFDGEQCLILMNARYAEMYRLPAELTQPGTPLDRILERRIANGFYAGDSPETYFRERRAVAAENAATTQIKHLADGRVISITHRPTPDGGWVATHDDITELKNAERALRESEELFSSAFQVSPAAGTISSPNEGRHYDVNQAWMDLLGYTREEAREHDAISLGIWADPEERRRFVELLEEHGSHKAFEAKFRRKDGTLIDVLASGVKVDFRDEQRLIVIYDDITKRKQAEAALLESQELFSRAFHTSPAACAIAAPEDGRHYDVNEGWMELLGYTREEALANSALTLGIWADPKERRRFVGLLEEHGSHKAFETVFCRKDGARIDVLVSGVKVEFRGETRLINIYDDITQRKRAERLSAQQAASMSLMKSIAFTANQSADIKVALDRCLSQICEYMRWEIGHVYIPAEDGSSALGSSDYWFLSDEERFRAFREATEKHPCAPEDGDMCCRVLEKGEARWARDVAASVGPCRAEAATALELKGGVAFPIKVRDRVVAILEFYATRPMKPSGSLVHILSEAGNQMGRVIERASNEAGLKAHQDHLEDLVQKRTVQLARQAQELEDALEKEKEVNAVQRQFVAMVSHEFRTPLTIIDSTAQRLERRAERMTPPEIVERAKKVRNAVKRSVNLIESVLNSASLDSGRLKIEAKTYDLRSLVEQVCARQRDISPDHIITSKLDALPTEMSGDPNLLEKVFVNLLSNAVKYSPDNPDIAVVGQVANDSVVVAVRDKGLGIPEKELPMLFERFFRASTATGIPGTGIGLNLVSQVVELHGGRVDIKSAEGEGSTFIIRLPMPACARAGKAGTPPMTEERRRSAS